MGAHTFTVSYVYIYEDFLATKTSVVFGAILILLLCPGIQTCLTSSWMAKRGDAKFMYCKRRLKLSSF